MTFVTVHNGVDPFYLETLTTTDQTTGLLVRSDRLVLGMR